MVGSNYSIRNGGNILTPLKDTNRSKVTEMTRKMQNISVTQMDIDDAAAKISEEVRSFEVYLCLYNQCNTP
jgi:isocitrate/isopropylmalate dehydrogenase